MTCFVIKALQPLYDTAPYIGILTVGVLVGSGFCTLIVMIEGRVVGSV